MDAILRGEPMIGFGRDPLNPYSPRPLEAVGAKSTRRLKDRVTESCPRVPGVYGMLDRKGELIYVGKSKSLRSRLLSYFAESNKKEKGGRIISAARAIQWETQPSEFASLLREMQLIRQFSPRWNVQGVPKRQRPVYLCLGRSPATFFLAPLPPEGCIAAEGPFFGVGRMKVAVDSLNNVFKLRDCGQKQVFRFAEQLQLFELDHRPGCLRVEVGTCLGPCAAACTHREYDVAVSAAESFMDGFNNEPLTTLRDQFDKAMKNRQYELAGRNHTMIESLEYVERKLTMLNSARRKYSFVYPVAGYDGCGIWYLIHSGEVADVIAAPRNEADRRSLRPTMKRWEKLMQTQLTRGHGPFAHTLPVVASWFRKNKSELKEKAVSPAKAS
ncbi:UvrABC system protein C [Rubripirellula amarantea]|uniref:UvrABC system protein C n=1 Tax=Rubripirellula amarantea TaxID=2527999 RepID=A0A5C5WKD1_9BACT|nr:GIY-YIG nuclease family protein [Rubripirellula amarantea]TWT50589.1 UvrABC system protein C [Rubripirellula amarantea]